MSQKKVLSFEELKTVNGRQFAEIEVYGAVVGIGSLSAFDMMEWLEQNEDPTQRREAGLRLIVKSIVDGDQKSLPAEQHAEFLESFRRKDARDNGTLIHAILKLNGMGLKAETVKNVSGEVNSGASPSGLPSPSAE